MTPEKEKTIKEEVYKKLIREVGNISGFTTTEIAKKAIDLAIEKTAKAIFDDLDSGDRIKGDIEVGKGVWWMDIDDYVELKKKWCK